MTDSLRTTPGPRLPDACFLRTHASIRGEGLRHAADTIEQLYGALAWTETALPVLAIFCRTGDFVQAAAKADEILETVRVTLKLARGEA